MSDSNSRLTQERLHEVLNYERETGVFTRRIRSARMAAGSPANSIDPSTGYVRFGVDGRLYYGHRLAWLFAYGEWPEYIDHINGIRHDNRLCNLRNVDITTNNRNMHGPRLTANRTSRFLGVCWCKAVGKWEASIKRGSTKVVLGYWNVEEDAGSAYMAAKRAHDGE